MSWIDFYLVAPNGQPQNFSAAKGLVASDDDAVYFIEGIEERFLNGPVDEDSDEVRVINGVQTFILQYHNGIGDGGARDICNVEWFARTYPVAYKLLGVTISWGKGTEALTGTPRGTA